MRVNVYAEETTDGVEIVSKEINGVVFTGLRFYLELPASYHRVLGGDIIPAKLGDTVPASQIKAPFLHGPGDDDSSAVTFWGKRDLRANLVRALALLDEHYTKFPPLKEVA